MNEVVERKFAGDTLKIRLLRDGKTLEKEVKLKRFDPYVRLGSQYNQRPRYLVYAGLVFQPLDRNLVDAHQVRDPVANYIFDNYLNDKIYVERPEPVMLTTVLTDEVNTHLAVYAQSVIDEINGVKIRSLQDVAEALKKQDAKKDFIVVKLIEKGRPLVLKRDLAESAHPRIMQTYGIPEDSYLGNE